MQTATAMPAGSEAIAHWAAQHRLKYQGLPDPIWFRRWEPFDTMVAPAHYINACSWVAPPGSAILVEPFTEEDLRDEPMDRTVLAFCSHPGLRYRASARSGEFFITRVSFLDSPPPPEVKLGDSIWDEHVSTRAPTPHDAAGAFPPPLRELLRTWGFKGHVEMRIGGAVLHCAGLKPVPADYERLGQLVPQVMNAALAD